MRAFMRVTAAILAAVVVSGCAERASGNGTPKTGVEWLDRENAPVNVRLAFDSANASSEVIGEAGGVVSATGSDGSYFSLEIPKGALHRSERITMIPVSRVDGLPLEKGGAVATVQLEPEGLRFDKPVKLTIELPATVHRDLLAYADVLARETGQPIVDPSKLVAPMLARFMATDRGFVKGRRVNQVAGNG